MASYSDNFAYSDGDLDTVSSGVWATPSGGEFAVVLSGTIAPGSNGTNANVGRYATALASVDQHVSLAVATGPGFSAVQLMGVAARMSTGNANRYIAWLGYDGGNTYIAVEREGSGAWGIHSLLSPDSIGPGDSVALDVVDSGGNAIITPYLNGSLYAATWSTRAGSPPTPDGNGVMTDTSSPPTGLYVGVTGYTATNPASLIRMDTWVGQDLSNDIAASIDTQGAVAIAGQAHGADFGFGLLSGAVAMLGQTVGSSISGGGGGPAADFIRRGISFPRWRRF